MPVRRIAVDPDLSPIAVYHALAKGGAQIHDVADPTRVPKAIKNPVEIEGMKQAHLRDGAALTQFLHWLAGEAPKGQQRSEEHTSELQSLMRNSYAVFCLKKKQRSTSTINNTY